jgi:hypothetical protein
MVGGTSFHRGILKAGLGRNEQKANATPRTTAKPPRREKSKPSLVHVSLDNADKVIEGGPLKPGFGLCKRRSKNRPHHAAQAE